METNYKKSLQVKKIPVISFRKRIDNYSKFIKYFINLNKKNCLVSVKKADNIYEYHLQNGVILLKNRIGSNSKYGLIYLTINKNIKKKLFSTKLTIMNISNKTEIIIASYLSKISLKKLSPHFLLIYKYFTCSNNLDKNTPDLIKNNKYFISVNELANGNLKNFLDINPSYDFLLNAFQQIIIAILSFHYFTRGIFHNDCHYKNFLYIKIKSGGYFHYKIFGKNYYIENMGYLWLIWDFGLARSEKEYKKLRIQDYFRIIEFFKNKLSIANQILLIKQKYILVDNDKIFFDNLIFKNNILLTDKQIPKLINKKPFIINDF